MLRKSTTGLFDFNNTELIKEKVRASQIRDPVYNVHDCYHESGFFQWLAKHSRFESVTLGVIVVNALWISVDTDGNTAETILDAEAIYVTADILFFAYFVFELVVRFIAFKYKRNCFRDAWFAFDFTLVSLYAFDPFLIGLITYLSGGAGISLPTAVLRLFRLARLSRLVRMLRSLPELMIMIKGMVSATTSVGYTLGLLILVTYVFAIALRNLVPKGSEIEEVYFSSVPEAMHNLIVFGTFLDALSDFILAVKEQSPACFVVTWLFISLSALTIMNMLIGVLCEVISAVAAEEKESMMVDKVNEKFAQIVHELDENNDGELSWAEFVKIIEYPAALKALESVNVDPETMVDMAEDAFHDINGDGVPMHFDQFMELILDVRGGQTCQVSNVMAVGKRFNGKFMVIKHRMNDMGERLEKIEGCLDQCLQAKVRSYS